MPGSQKRVLIREIGHGPDLNRRDDQRGSPAVMNNITLDTIADHLGISKFAVSRALTGKPGVSEQTRRSVIDIAEKLGYRAHLKRAMNARSLQVIFHDRRVAGRELWTDVQLGIEMEAGRWGLHTAVRWTDDYRIIARTERSAVGFILVGPHDDEMLQAARDSASPAVTVSHTVPPLDGIDQVAATDVEAGEYVGDYLWRMGHQRFGYVHGQLGFPGREARLRGLGNSIARHTGANLKEIALARDDAVGEFTTAFLAMAEGGFEPTALFCGSDDVAATVVAGLARLGLRVPGDVSVVGHADYPIAARMAPQLTTVRMPHRQMGLTAVRLLLTRAGLILPLADQTPMRVSLVPHLVCRQTCGPPGQEPWRPRLLR
jgi:LacI family transcriptional regulator